MKSLKILSVVFATLIITAAQAETCPVEETQGEIVAILTTDTESVKVIVAPNAEGKLEITEISEVIAC